MSIVTLLVVRMSFVGLPELTVIVLTPAPNEVCTVTVVDLMPPGVVPMVSAELAL
jgi:hypothetical protein